MTGSNAGSRSNQSLGCEKNTAQATKNANINAVGATGWCQAKVRPATPDANDIVEVNQAL